MTKDGIEIHKVSYIFIAETIQFNRLLTEMSIQ